MGETNLPRKNVAAGGERLTSLGGFVCGRGGDACEPVSFTTCRGVGPDEVSGKMDFASLLAYQ
jgi:hypothetical protein